MTNGLAVTRLCGFAVRRGQPRDLSTLAVPEAQRQQLRRLGLWRYTWSDRTTLRVQMREAAASALSATGIEARSIDRVLLATSDFTQATDRDDLASLALALGLDQAVPLGVSQGFCTNFSLAFEVGAALIAAGRARRLLLVTADRYWSDEARVLRSNAGLGSDGAAACIMTSDRLPGYELRAIAHAYAPEAATLQSPDRLVEYVQTYASGYRSACAHALRDAGLASADCRWLVTPSFSGTVLRNLAELAGIDRARLHAADAGAVAHCNSVDQIAALAELSESLENGEAVLVTGAGEHLWGAVVATRVR
jgi:3-oxoacyl-[acyl-carrier-protein] synthase-3